MPYLNILSLNKVSTPSFPSSFRTDSWEDNWLALRHHIVVTLRGSPWNQDEQKEKQTYISFHTHSRAYIPRARVQHYATHLHFLSVPSSDARTMQLHCVSSSSQLLEANGFPRIRRFHISRWPQPNKGFIGSPLKFHKS